MDDAVGIDIDEFPEPVRGVVWADEATAHAGHRPLCVQRVCIGDADVHHPSGPERLIRVFGMQVHLDTPAFDEAVLRLLVQLDRKAESSVAIERFGEVWYREHGTDAFEEHFGHDGTS